eukprot:COSAG06_NODE_14553_length_1147_cov_1.661260_3_plen_94_part_01
MFDAHRVLEISTWRNIDDSPIERLPLALCDRLSLRRDDLQAIPLILVRLNRFRNTHIVELCHSELAVCLTLDHCGTHRATSQGMKVSGGQIFIS